MKHIKHTDKIWSIENFLSEKECEDLILFSEMRGFKEAEVSLRAGAKMIKGIRNNDRLLFEKPLASEIWEKLKQYCPETIENSKAIGLNERFRFYRYEKGQRFKRHIDGRYRRNKTEESRITFMVYLNQDFEGGKTKFDEVTIVPKTGSALCFIHEQKHESIPIQAGVKYALRTDVMYKKIEP